jgi:PAS domain S-box-containing protein
LPTKENNGAKVSKQTIAKRKQSQGKNELSYQTIAESLDLIRDSFYVLDRSWNFVYANKKTTDFVGMEPKDFLGQNFWVIFPKHVGTPLGLNLRAALENREIRKFEMPGKYGEAWYDVTIYPLTDGITVLATDITERKKVEEEVKSSKLLLESVFNNMYEGVFILDKTGKVIDFNEAFWRINKFKSREETLKSIDSLGAVFKAYRLNGSYVPVEEWPATKALQGESGTDQEYIVERTDLGVRWISSNSYAPLRNEKGEIVGAIQTMHDITERKKVEEALRESEERFRLALKNAPVSVAAQDCDLRYIWAYNQRTAQSNQIIGKLDKEIFTAKEAAHIDQVKRRVLEEDIELREQMWLERPSGRIYLDITWEPIHDQNGQVIGVASATVDLTRMKEIEEMLKESEQRWETTLASIGDAVIATDTAGNITFMNGEAEGLTCWRLHDALHKPVNEVFNIVNEQTRLEVENPIAKVLKEGNVCGLANHTVLIRKDGLEVPIDDSGAPIRDKESKITGVVLVFRDITERKKAEEALRKSEEEYSSLFANMIDGFAYCQMIFDEADKPVDFVYLQINDAFERITGLKRELVVGKKVTEAIPGIKAANAELFEIYGRVALTCRKERFEVFFKPLSMWLNISVYCPRRGYFAAVFEDVTERKKAEEELKKAKEGLEVQVQQRTAQVADERKRLFDIMETVPIMICLLTPDHHVAFANRSFREKFGESKGRYCYDFCFGKSEPCDFCESYKVLETGKPHRWQVKGSDGSVIDAYDFPFTDIDGSKMILEMDIDITEQKRVEKQLKDSERLAAIGATAGMVGHDIRNPLQAITGDLYLAKTELSALPENELKSNAFESLTEIEKNIDYINKIVQDLQDYARPLNPRAQETNIKSLFNEILAKNGIPKNIKVTVEVEDNADKVMADPDYLKRIAANLTLNAVQAMPEGGELIIRGYVDKQTNDILITVKDTGVGIPENVKPKLFTPMMTTKSKGQGFGLAVVKRMTEGLDGTVTFESTEGKGTTFMVRLPPPKAAKR